MTDRITPSELWPRIDEVRAVADDTGGRGSPARAHELEDQLRADVLRSIAVYGDTDSRTVARLALTTDEIEFSRWYS